jgi:hypothetical protein
VEGRECVDRVANRYCVKFIGPEDAGSPFIPLYPIEGGFHKQEDYSKMEARTLDSQNVTAHSAAGYNCLPTANVSRVAVGAYVTVTSTALLSVFLNEISVVKTYRESKNTRTDVCLCLG